MQSAKHITLLGLAVILSLLGLLALAGPSAPTYALPSRDTPTPRPHKEHDDGPPAGATIELRAEGASAGAWAVVQWQDSAGNWHDVEGWRGRLDEGNQRWWVHPKDFGTGPFRWAVYQGQTGPLLATSAPFHLPVQAAETRWVEAWPER